MRAPRESPGGLRLLRAAAFLSNFDRFTVAPMLLTIAADLRVFAPRKLQRWRACTTFSTA